MVAIPQLSDVVIVLGYCGIAVFTVSGALDAARKQMDILGFILIGLATGLGGGTLRDLLLGATPVYWVREPAYISLGVAVAVTTYFVVPYIEGRKRALVWMDAIGLALFCVTGTQTALSHGASPLVAVSMGVMTATFGGIIRDVLCAESLVLGGRELYVTAAVAGASFHLLLVELGLPGDLALVGGFIVALLLRSCAILFGWQLPVHGGR